MMIVIDEAMPTSTAQEEHLKALTPFESNTLYTPFTILTIVHDVAIVAVTKIKVNFAK